MCNASKSLLRIAPELFDYKVALVDSRIKKDTNNKHVEQAQVLSRLLLIYADCRKFPSSCPDYFPIYVDYIPFYADWNFIPV